MTNKTTYKFMTPNGTFNTQAAMQAGHDARTEGLRSLIRDGADFLKSFLQRNLVRTSLTNLRT